MSSDQRGDGVHRPRLVPQPQVPPGPLRDLKQLLYELYLTAGAPSLDQISALACEDDGLPGAPGRDTVRRVLGSPTLPPSQADVVSVARVLARTAAWDEHDAAQRVRQLWVAAHLAVPIGTPIDDLTDPFALEVHRPIDPGGSPETVPSLPPYVRRAHDCQLAEVVAQAVAGQSRIAVLVGGSSTGKTRAWWEAVQTLPEGWRLWHPLDPTRPEAALAGLHQIGPRTVVWLNETQLYLDTPGEAGERVAAALRVVLADPARAPVLVAGTLWPEHWDRITRQGAPGDPHAQARQVLAGNDIVVPASFADADLKALNEIATQDPRLRAAVKHGQNGAIAQFLAGVPELLARYRHAPPAARALVDAAADARRLGYGPALPRGFLEAAAPGYLSDDEWDALGDKWLEQALAYTAAPCRGVRGLLTRVRPRTGSEQVAPESDGGQPCYRLSDYLEQIHGRARAATLPPAVFWEAAAAFADLDVLSALAAAAQARGLWRHAARWNERAMLAGRADAAARLNEILAAVAPDDAAEAGKVAAEHVDLTDAAAVASLLTKLVRARVQDAVVALLARDPAEHADLTDIGKVVMLLEALHEAGADETARIVAERAVPSIDIDDMLHVTGLLDAMSTVGAEHAIVLLHSRTMAGSARFAYRARRHPVNGWDFTVIRKGAGISPQEIAEKLADKRVDPVKAQELASSIDVNNPELIAGLLEALHSGGATEAIKTLLNRDVASQLDVTGILESSRPNRILEALHLVGAHQQAGVLAERIAAQYLDLKPFVLEPLVQALQRAGNEDAARAIAERAAEGVNLNDSLHVSHLLEILHSTGAHEAIRGLLSQDFASKVDPTYTYGVARILKALQRIGAKETASALAERSIPLTDPTSHAAQDLLEALAEVNIPASDEIDDFALRVANAGLFQECLNAFQGWREKFRFGRECNGAASPQWHWSNHR